MAAVAVAALGWMIFGNPVAAASVVGMSAVSWIPVMLLALVLRFTRSLALTIEVAAALGCVVILAIYAWMGDPIPMWRSLLDSTLLPAFEAAGLEGNAAVSGDMLDQAAGLMTRTMMTAISLSLCACLLVARWWQAGLYNPGGFREEFHTLRLQRQFAFAGSALMAVSMTTSGMLSQLTGDLALPLLSVFLIQGLAMVHGVVQISGAHQGWLIGLYVLMILALPQLLMVLAMVGLLDVFLDFRARWAAKQA